MIRSLVEALAPVRWSPPLICGLELMDDPSRLSDQYENDVVWDGLGFVKFSIVPHCYSDHPESHLATLTAAFMEANGIAHIAMKDGDVFVSNGGHGQLLAARSSKPNNDAVKLGDSVRR